MPYSDAGVKYEFDLSTVVAHQRVLKVRYILMFANRLVDETCAPGVCGLKDRVVQPQELG